MMGGRRVKDREEGEKMFGKQEARMLPQVMASPSGEGRMQLPLLRCFPLLPRTCPDLLASCKRVAVGVTRESLNLVVRGLIIREVVGEEEEDRGGEGGIRDMSRFLGEGSRRRRLGVTSKISGKLCKLVEEQKTHMENHLAV